MFRGTQTQYREFRRRIRSERINRLTLSIAALFCLAAPAAFGQHAGPFPGSPVNSATFKTQEKVEELFENGEYERAHFIYRNELAPIGDKYAQYMVGFMTLTGTGVEEDPLLASAWYRLAAERGYPEFLTVRDELLNNLSEVDKSRSDQLYLRIRREYSDVVILMNLVKADIEGISARTGSRLTGGNGPVTIVDPRAGSSVSSAEYFRRLRSRTDARLRFMAEQLGDDSIITAADDVDIPALESLVRRHVETITDR